MGSWSAIIQIAITFADKWALVRSETIEETMKKVKKEKKKCYP